MATRAQKTKVGAFLLLSAALIVVGLYMISQYGKRGEVHYHVFFHESVLGLNVGSPVVFMGVPVGSVDEIDVQTGKNEKTGQETYIPKATLLLKSDDGFVLREGVTAKLSIYSLATGTLAITLEGGNPSSPPLQEGATIPTDPSVFNAVTTRVEELMTNVQGLITDVDKAVGVLNDSLEGMEKGELTRIVRDAAATIEETRDLAASANDTFESIQGDATEGVKDLRGAIEDVKTLAQETTELVKTVGDKIEPLDVGSTQEKLNESLDQVNVLMKDLQGVSETIKKATESVTHETGNVEYSVREGLRSLTDTLESLREMIEYLRDNPSALIRGRGRAEGE